MDIRSTSKPLFAHIGQCTLHVTGQLAALTEVHLLQHTEVVGTRPKAILTDDGLADLFLGVATTATFAKPLANGQTEPGINILCKLVLQKRGYIYPSGTQQILVVTGLWDVEAQASGLSLWRLRFAVGCTNSAADHLADGTGSMQQIAVGECVALMTNNILLDAG
jgi:hypothetical protein